MHRGILRGRGGRRHPATRTTSCAVPGGELWHPALVIAGLLTQWAQPNAHQATQHTVYLTPRGVGRAQRFGRGGGPQPRQDGPPGMATDWQPAQIGASPASRRSCSNISSETHVCGPNRRHDGAQPFQSARTPSDRTVDPRQCAIDEYLPAGRQAAGARQWQHPQHARSAWQWARATRGNGGIPSMRAALGNGAARATRGSRS